MRTALFSLDADPPACHDEARFVATNDTVLMHKDAKRSKKTLDRLDAAFATNGIPKNASKDASLASSLTALGCDLSSVPAPVEPNDAKLAEAIAQVPSFPLRPQRSLEYLAVVRAHAAGFLQHL